MGEESTKALNVCVGTGKDGEGRGRQRGNVTVGGGSIIVGMDSRTCARSLSHMYCCTVVLMMSNAYTPAYASILRVLLTRCNLSTIAQPFPEHHTHPPQVVPAATFAALLMPFRILAPPCIHQQHCQSPP